MLAIFESVNGELRWEFEPDLPFSPEVTLTSEFYLKHCDTMTVLVLLADRYACGNYYSEEF